MLLFATACARIRRAPPAPPPLAEPVIAAESIQVITVAPGVKHRYYWIAKGPWAVNVLDVDRSACWTPVAIKGSRYAVGRTKTSTLVSAYADSARRRGVIVAGGVNADFFSFAPPGVPVGAHIHRGRTFTGPVDRPVLAVNEDNSLYVGTLSITIRASNGKGSTSARWNHPGRGAVSVVDHAYGERTDTATGAIEAVLTEIPVIALIPPRGYRDPTLRMAGVVTEIDTSPQGIRIPRNGFLLTAGQSDQERHTFVRNLSVGDTVQLSARYAGAPPIEAVGGFPMLVRSDSVAGDVHTAGNAGFRGRNPRTAVGIGSRGRRVLFVTVDGRQTGFSEGMTLEELANLMRELGASDAMNLDGGGSTTFVVADTSGSFRVANRPSDREGERPVANAVAVERICGTGTRK